MDSNFNFLEIYDNLLSKEDCNQLISDFNKISPMSGRLNYSNGNDAKKLGTTLYCDFNEDLFSDYNDYIMGTLYKGLPKYLEKYSFVKTGVDVWKCSRYYNIQKYKEGEGYFTIHCEQDCAKFSSRMLVWMIYLNDAECGTEFPYQDTIVDAKQGRLVLWPAAWTHPHKGVTPNKGLKYIVTGWYTYLDETTTPLS